MDILKAENVSYSYRTKYQTVHAVKEVTCGFEQGKLYAITGESGSGKSTFLSLLAGLDVPETGTIWYEGQMLAELNRDKYRREQAAVVYQSFHLFPRLTVLENVMFPLELLGMKRKLAEGQAKELLESVGLDKKDSCRFPQMLSGGQQQRAAIARALAGEKKVLLADEPTGNLDTENEKRIMELLQQAAHEKGITVIIVTHNLEVAAQADVVLRMRDGRIVEVSRICGKTV